MNDYEDDFSELNSALLYVSDNVLFNMTVNDPQFFDQYQGYYNDFEIECVGSWRAWMLEEGLFIEDFIIQNNNEKEKSGFVGHQDYLVELLNNKNFIRKMVEVQFTGKNEVYRCKRQS